MADLKTQLAAAEADKLSLRQEARAAADAAADAATDPAAGAECASETEAAQQSAACPPTRESDGAAESLRVELMESNAARELLEVCFMIIYLNGFVKHLLSSCSPP